MASKYPLTGFDKITWEECLGIYETMKLFGSLSEKDKDIILLLMDGMKFRAKNRNEKDEKENSQTSSH